MNQNVRALVIGAGISGIRAALDLAEAGHSVLLTEKALAPGGLLLSLDRQFPDNHCGLCRILPGDITGRVWNACMRRGFGHPDIEYLPGVEVLDIQGTPGNLSALMNRRGLKVDPQKCTGCLECLKVCPVSQPYPLAPGLGQCKAVHPSAPHKPDNWLSINPDACTLCGKCMEVCPTGAIHAAEGNGPESMDKLSLAVLATGVEYFDPQLHNHLGCGHWPDAITSLDFERLISGVGPTRGVLRRPSDLGKVRKAAWIQCAGSRNLKLNADHCSGICCMIALKQALLAREKGMQCALFYMDLRTPGRNWQKYLNQAQQKGIRLIRCRPHSIVRDPGEDSLRIAYAPAPGEQRDENFDLIVFSVGRDPGYKLPAWAGQEGVIVTKGSERVLDIAGSLIAASAAAGRALRSFSDSCAQPGGEAYVSEHEHIHPSVLVVGGGPAGLSAALSLAEQKTQVVLVEKKDHLGGHAIKSMVPEVREQVLELRDKVQKHPEIEVLNEARLQSCTGPAGRFVARLLDARGHKREVKHGAAILACGTNPSRVETEDPRIINVFDLPEKLLSPDAPGNSSGRTVFILCSGTRREPADYCSKVCCQLALRQAIEIRRLNPESEVTIFYRDIIVQGDDEQLYTRARSDGVCFIPYLPEKPPVFQAGEKSVTVQGVDPYLKEDLQIEADRLILASGVIPESASDLARIFDIQSTEHGFLKEADVKYRPLDSVRAGIFVCGSGRNPVLAGEAVLEGEAAAQTALSWLARGRRNWPGSFVRVKTALCSLCAMCLQACPFKARYPDEHTGAMAVDALACQGCGACIAVCPNKASAWAGQEEEEMHELE